MKVLFLDDDKDRMKEAEIKFVEDELTKVETVEQAIEMLEQNSPYDLVSLDHDLGGEIFCPSDEVSGFAVAKFISQMTKDKLHERVVVHSFNPDGARNMMDVLQGIVPIEQQAFGILE